MTAARAAPPAIVLSRVTLGYDGKPVLREVDWTIAPGSLTALVGPNGGGKSTLLKAVAGEIAPVAGGIAGLDRRQIAYLPQTVEFDRTFPILVRDVVAMGLWHRLGPFGHLGRVHGELVASALADVGLAGFGGRPVGALSGGELQRVLFARLSLLDAPVILLDEPFAAIDRDTVAVLIGTIRRWHGENRTVVAALHDLDQVRAVFPETIRVAGERAVLGATADMLGVAALAVPAADGFRPGAIA